jgi:putative Mg2+ transporter-C (MgtC) family protein
MGEFFQVIADEFSDLSGPQAVRLAIRLTVAAVLGGAVGWDRERHGKAAGFRTHILVAVGSAAFVAVPQQSGASPEAVSRILQGLIAGIGFLGAGCILKSTNEEQVKGLTTAASIWLTAAVGIAAGMGRELSAVIIGLFGFFVLTVLHRWDIRRALGATTPAERRSANSPPK